MCPRSKNTNTLSTPVKFFLSDYFDTGRFGEPDPLPRHLDTPQIPVRARNRMTLSPSTWRPVPTRS